MIRLREHSATPGRCLSVCAACGAAVNVPPAAGHPPKLAHLSNCPRTGWPITDAVRYDDGTEATESNWTAGTPLPGSGEHPHQGVIQAVAHLSDAYAKALSADHEPGEHNADIYSIEAMATLGEAFHDLADHWMEPFGVADVLQTVEETIAAGRPIIERYPDGATRWVAGGDRGVLRARVAIVTAIVDTADVAREDEQEPSMPSFEPFEPDELDDVATILADIRHSLDPWGGTTPPDHSLTEQAEDVQKLVELEARGRVEAREALRELATAIQAPTEFTPEASRARAALLNATATLEGGERTHILVPREGVVKAAWFARCRAKSPVGLDARSEAKLWEEALLAAERGEHVEWPAIDTQEGR